MSDFDPYYDETTWDEWDEEREWDDEDRFDPFDDDADEQYLNQWNPETNPPAWYNCRVCNGNGVDPYQLTCHACGGTGFSFRPVFWLFSVGWWLKGWLSGFRYCRECGRVYYRRLFAYCPNADCKSHDDLFPF